MSDNGGQKPAASNTAPNEVKLTIDGVEVRVPKGTNLIDAAARAGSDVPYYCYHPHLSVAGNCRMCQVQVEGNPKLTIACNTQATEGMVVRTQRSSKDVSEAQRSTLEFLLINHPLDCTVCDQAGHCKLQDYYYQYNAKPSRFIEDKVHKVKAEPLGEEVIYDGERCILCTRCVRFCDEVTETGELGLFNRGDRAVIGTTSGKPLANPLAGSVVDLCPVGALTHRQWRFNTRIWYTNSAESVCTGCSTGCNIKAHDRDGRIVHVKARLNSDVNKEWMCDEGRYGFERFQPIVRLANPLQKTGSERKPLAQDAALKEVSKIFATPGETVVFLSPFLTLEEMWMVRELSRDVLKAADSDVVVQVQTRKLSPVEAKLISPDYAPNAYSAVLLGMGVRAGANWREELSARYQAALSKLRAGSFTKVLLIGDLAILDADLDAGVRAALERCESVALTPRGVSTADIPANTNLMATQLTTSISDCVKLLLPTRTVNEKNGTLVNSTGRLQRLKNILQAPFGTQPEWLWLQRIGAAAGKPLVAATVADERALFREMVGKIPELSGVTLAQLGTTGASVENARGSVSANVQASQ